MGFSLRDFLVEISFYVQVSPRSLWIYFLGFDFYLKGAVRVFFPSDFKGTVRVFSLWTSKEQFGFFPLWTLKERFLFFPIFGLKVFF